MTLHTALTALVQLRHAAIRGAVHAAMHAPHHIPEEKFDELFDALGLAPRPCAGGVPGVYWGAWPNKIGAGVSGRRRRGSSR
jgi:hypothetical protein